MKRRSYALALASTLLLNAPLLAAEPAAPAAASPAGDYLLTDFGDTTTPNAIQETLAKAVELIRAKGGGRLIIPPGVDQTVNIQNLSETERIAGYIGAPVVTIVDRRSGYEKILVPQIGKWSTGGWSGQSVKRELNLQGPGLSSWGNSQVVGLENRIVHGSSSYLHPARSAGAKGPDSRVYVYTERGLYVGQYLNYYLGAGYGGGHEPITVKSIGWDKELKQFYFTASLTKDHANGAYLSNKNMLGSLNINSTSQSDNQTPGDLSVTRKQYANGDSFLISGTYIYQGDVLTQLGDEAGVIFNAETIQDPNAFYSKVEKVDPTKDEVTFAPGVANVDKLSSSRPLINMNPKKWVTAGTVKIVNQENSGGFMVQDPNFDTAAAVQNGVDLKSFKYTFKLKPGEKSSAMVYGGATPFDNLYKAGKEIPTVITWDGHPVTKFKYVYQGKAYPSLHNKAVNYLGGRIIASADCGWTPDIVGRYFAVADKGEMLYPGDPTIGEPYIVGTTARDTYRWYRIDSYWKNPDGTHGIRLGRVRMFAAGAGAPNLYNEDNYTWDGHERPLKYIIAPGSMVYDVSKGWKDTAGGETSATDPRTIKVAGSSARGTSFDFEPGDDIQQAIGADPAIPRPFRVRMFNMVPDNFYSSAIELNNVGKVAINAALTTAGGGQSLEDIQNRKDRKPSFIYGIDLSSVMGDGVRFGADVTNSAILFEQPFGHAQPMKWKHAGGTTALTVDPKTGLMGIFGSKLQVSGVQGARGLSGTGVAANNLRGINVRIPKGARSFTVKFPRAETDANYSLNVQPGWFTQDAVTSKTAHGFTVKFTAPASAGAKLDWQLIR